MILDWLRNLRQQLAGNRFFAGRRRYRVRRKGTHHFRSAEALESRVLLAAAVDGRHLFYNNSMFDDPVGQTGDPAINANDDAAISDKVALQPGTAATFVNYTNYSRGINGVMIDIADAPGTLTAADFSFQVGNSPDLSTWNHAPTTNGFAIRPGAGDGGSDRITFTWADGAIQDQWLQVTVFANANTGLMTPDVHYWGHQLGETGNDATTTVNFDDTLLVLNNPSGFIPAPVSSPYDIDRDGRVNVNDTLLVLNNPSGFTSLNLFQPTLPPTLTEIPDQITSVGTEITFTATATDLDVPSQTLIYSLDAGAPAGAVIDPGTGLFAWTPPVSDGLGPVNITIRVTDSLGASDSQTITIDVIPAVGVAFSAQELDFVHRSLEFDGDGASGAVWFDYNNDHHVDLFLPNGRTQTSVLYENQGDGTFVDVTVAAGLTSTTGGAAVVAGDIDNDGNVDLLITGDGGVIKNVPPAFMVYRNQGDGTFSDITAASGITEPDGSGTVSLADVNNDGFLDVFITGFGSFEPAPPVQTASKLYLNDGDLTFTDVTVAAGIGPHLGACVAGFSDYDMDGDVDLFISNCNDVTFAPTPIQLFQNDGTGVFTDVTAAAGFATELGFWMATSFADYDNDGDIDLFATNSGDAPGPHGGSPHGLFQNQGDGTFINVAAAAGVSAWEFGWGAAFDDLDNDGVVDLFFTGSLPTAPFNVIGPGLGNPGRLFFGDGAGAFTEASVNLGIDQSDDYTSGVAYGDYNQDGFHDIVIVTEKWEPTRTGKPVLLTNQGNGNHWLGVKLVGTTSNRDGVGAKVTLKYGDTENLSQVKEVYAGTSFASMDSQSLRFGVGQNLNATTVQVDWPSGLVETFHIWQGIDQVVTLTEGEGTPVGEIFLDPIFDVQVTSDIIYRYDAPVNQGAVTQIPLQLDLYEPVGLGLPAELPAAILVHGGAFVAGDKADPAFAALAQDFASRGYVTVSINYRLEGDVPPDANNPPPAGVPQSLYNAIVAGVEDTFHAIDWLKDSAADLNVDPNRIVLGGHSAGAYLSLYAGVLDEAENNAPPLLASPLIDTAGINLSELGVAGILDMAGSIEGLEYAVDAGDPPVFIAHSTDDAIVSIAQANNVASEWTTDAIPFEFPAINGVGHSLNGKLNFVIGNETVRDQIFDFFDQQLTLNTLPLRTTGLFYNKPGTSDDYTLFSPNTTGDTYLINKNGDILNHWQSQYPPGLHAYLLPDGSLVRAANAEGSNAHIIANGGGGLIERFDWHGNLVWTYDYNHDATFETAVWQHHDFEVMPNGNILMIAWETMSAAEAEQAGRDDTLPGGGGGFLPDHIVEVQPDLVAGVGGTIVWEWHAIDHLVQDHDPTKDNWYGPNGVAEHPELINFNYLSDETNGGSPPSDWLHANGIDYNADLDQILISIREFNEIWIIDHSTTTAEAAGHNGGNSGKGGDLLYRWGNPQAYNAGDESDRQLFFQHDPKWVETGHPGPDVNYGSGQSYSAGGSGTKGLAVADFNNDQIPDLVSVNQFSGSAGVIFGTGNGNFGPTTTLSVNSQPYDVVASDFNNDGIPDLAASNFESNLVTVRLSNGDGTFSAAQTFATGNGSVFPASTGVWYVDSGDFNGDGNNDIVTANLRHDFLSILIGDGNGGFAAPISSSIGSHPDPPPHQNGPKDMVLHDFNNDGHLDVAVPILGIDSVRILTGDGTGALTLNGTYFVGDRPVGLASGDVNKDGNIDLIAGNTDSVGLLLGDGLGGFAPVTQYATPGLWPAGAVGGNNPAVGDIDLDGNLDIVTAGSSLLILKGDGTGNFIAEPASNIIGNNARELRVADLNNDGVLDITYVFTDPTNSIGVVLGQQSQSHITIFNNGLSGPERSSIVEIQTTVDAFGDYAVPAPGTAHGPSAPVFSYTAPYADYSMIISGTQRLDNGNTLLTYGGDGTFVEVTPNGEEVWRYTNPYTGAGMLGPSDPVPPLGFVDLDQNFVFRATNYDPGYFDAGLIPAAPTALDLYVAAPDDSYGYTFNSSFTGTLGGTNYTAYVLDVNSQTWMDASVVATPTWQHWVTMIVPDGVTSDTAILHIDGGSQTASAPTVADSFALQTAIDTGMIVINLPTVPNQPQQFFSDGVDRFEDNIIAYTFDKYLETGDDTWPLLLPMVKSAVATMDTAQDYATTLPFSIDDFIVTGASKRGWTTWLTAAVDNRVTAIAPMVIDVLNMNAQMPHHFEHYSTGTVNPLTLVDGYSIAIQDYVNFNIIQRLGDPGSAELRAIVDPYEYRDRLTLPKYLINGTGDEFFVPDSGQFYLDDLQGPTYVRYVPNVGHGLNTDAVVGAGSFFAAIDAGAVTPAYDWTVELDGERIRLNTVDVPVEVRMWQATNPITLDFRQGYEPATAPVWTSSILTETAPGSGEYVAQVTPPASGGTGFFVEMTYNVGGETLKFTTEISIVEPPPAPTALPAESAPLEEAQAVKTFQSGYALVEQSVVVTKKEDINASRLRAVRQTTSDADAVAVNQPDRSPSRTVIRFPAKREDRTDESEEIQARHSMVLQPSTVDEQLRMKLKVSLSPGQKLSEGNLR